MSEITQAHMDKARELSPCDMEDEYNECEGCIRMPLIARALADAEEQGREAEFRDICHPKHRLHRTIVAGAEDEHFQRGAEAMREKWEPVLAFYADPDTYFAIGIFPDPPNGPFMDDFSKTAELGHKPGKRAREALALPTPEEPSK